MARPQLGQGSSSAAIKEEMIKIIALPIKKKIITPPMQLRIQMVVGNQGSRTCSPLRDIWSMAAPVLTVASKRDPLYVAIGNEIKPRPPGSAREPVTVMQRPQSANQKHSSVSFVGHPPGPAASWHPVSSQLDIIKSSGLSTQIPPRGRNPSPWSATSGTMHGQLNYQQQVVTPANSRKIGFQQHQFMPGGGVVGDVPIPGQGNPFLADDGRLAASSLGLFSSAGSGSASLGPVNWTDGGNVLKLNYSNIDWSLEATSPRSSSSLWLGLSSLTKNRTTTLYNSNISRSSSVFGLPSTASSSEAPASDARDWTSPFEGKDLFSLPRQFVSSPSL